jgi:hypothetical protein
VPELVDARVQQETLEAEDTRLVQCGQLRQVSRHGTTPEADVGVGAAERGGTLEVQRRHVHGRRHAVERHVDDRRDPASRGGTGGGRETLPLAAAGVVDVHVRVDEAG